MLSSLAILLLVGAAAKTLESPVIGSGNPSGEAQIADIQPPPEMSSSEKRGADLPQMQPISGTQLSRPSFANRDISTGRGLHRDMSSAVTGTIVKDGPTFVLQDASGRRYRLENFQDAKSFEGKSVELTGSLREDSGLMYVRKIGQPTP